MGPGFDVDHSRTQRGADQGSNENALALRTLASPRSACVEKTVRAGELGRTTCSPRFPATRAVVPIGSSVAQFEGRHRSWCQPRGGMDAAFRRRGREARARKAAETGPRSCAAINGKSRRESSRGDEARSGSDGARQQPTTTRQEQRLPVRPWDPIAMALCRVPPGL